ncbi:hypothetical protein ACFL16_02545 [Patescibacteria group bacterium]
MANFVPSLYVQNKGEDSVDIALKLTVARDKIIVRFTGGCGYMSPEDAQGMNNFFVDSFLGFGGAMIFGGTRMILRESKEIVSGITEIPSLIHRKCKDSVILGVVPRSNELMISGEDGLIVSDEAGEDYITVVHPEQDACLVVQQSVDQGVSWEAEFLECIKITEKLRSLVRWKSILVSYNGGGVTEKEIVAIAKLGWPVILIKGSGRKSDEYANDSQFLVRHPNVKVVDNGDVLGMRRILCELSALSEVEMAEINRKYFMRIV